MHFVRERAQLYQDCCCLPAFIFLRLLDAVDGRVLAARGYKIKVSFSRRVSIVRLFVSALCDVHFKLKSTFVSAACARFCVCQRQDHATLKSFWRQPQFMEKQSFTRSQLYYAQLS